jgi:hypothetical protein
MALYVNMGTWDFGSIRLYGHGTLGACDFGRMGLCEHGTLEAWALRLLPIKCLPLWCGIKKKLCLQFSPKYRLKWFQMQNVLDILKFILIVLARFEAIRRIRLACRILQLFKNLTDNSVFEADNFF